MAYEHGTTLDDAIAITLDEYETDRERYLRSDPTNAYLDLVDAVASVLVQGSAELAIPSAADDDNVGWDPHRKLVN